MLKIDLSGEKNSRKKTQDIPDINNLREELREKKILVHKTSIFGKQARGENSSFQSLHPEEEMANTGIRRKKFPFLISLIVIVVLALVYFQGGNFRKLIFHPKPSLSGIARNRNMPSFTKETPENLTKQPSSPDSSMKKISASSESEEGLDPVLAALDRLSKSTPYHVWLTEAAVAADGSYDIRGMSFFTSSIDSLASGLDNTGSVIARDIPKPSNLPDKKYYFKISGKMSGIKITNNLAVIPLEMLISMGDSLKSIAERGCAISVKLPKKGQDVRDDDLPFVVEGSFSGLQKMLRELTLDSRYRIHRLLIRPAGNGKTFNRVRASFSLRTSSSK
jgi:hypothetical protein